MTSPINSSRPPMSSANRASYPSLTWSEVGQKAAAGWCGDDAGSKVSSLTFDEKDFNSGSSDDGAGQKSSVSEYDGGWEGRRGFDERGGGSSCDSQSGDKKKNEILRSIGISSVDQEVHYPHVRRVSYLSKISNLSNSSSDERGWDEDDGVTEACSNTATFEGVGASSANDDGGEVKKGSGPEQVKQQLATRHLDEVVEKKKISRKRPAPTTTIDEDEAAASLIFFTQAVAASTTALSHSRSSETAGGAAVGSKKKRRTELEVKTESGSSTGGSASASSLSTGSIKRQKTFPEQLMDMLNEEALGGASHDIICWMPDGKSFLVRNPDVLCKEILPRYFHNSSRGSSSGAAKFDSFRRKLYRWGFKIRTEIDEEMNGGGDEDDKEMTDMEYDLLGHESMLFYHKYFRRSDHRLCRRMKSVVAPRGKKKAEIEAKAKAKTIASEITEIKFKERCEKVSSPRETSQSAEKERIDNQDQDQPWVAAATKSALPASESAASQEAERAAAMGAAAGAAATPEMSFATARAREADARMLPPSPRVVSVPTSAVLAAAPGAAAAFAAPAVGTAATNAGALSSALAAVAATTAGSAIPTSFCSSPMSSPPLLPLQQQASAPAAQVPSQNAQQTLAILRAVEEQQRQLQQRQTEELSERIVRAVAEYQQRHVPQRQPPQAQVQLAVTIRGAVDRAMRNLAKQENDIMALLVHGMCLSAVQRQQQQHR